MYGPSRIGREPSTAPLACGAIPKVGWGLCLDSRKGMESKNWVLDAEMAMENVRKTAEMEFEHLKKDFPAWRENDARRWAVARFPTIFFVPTLGLYLMRSYMGDVAWWERYAPGSGSDLLKNGWQHFDRHLKGKLILDLVGGVEHPFRVILNSLDPAN